MGLGGITPVSRLLDQLSQIKKTSFLQRNPSQVVSQKNFWFPFWIRFLILFLFIVSGGVFLQHQYLKEKKIRMPSSVEDFSKKEESLEERNKQVLKLYHQGLYQEALENWVSLYGKYSTHSELLMSIGASYRLLGQFDKARQSYIGYIVEKGPSASVYNNLGYLEYKAGDFEKSEENYLIALEMEPEFEVTLYNLATLYEKQKNWEKSLDYYKRYLKVSGENDEIWNRKINILSAFLDLEVE